ncbi:unnamed protein product [Mytilus coruscus]|uniref:Tyr recombinase domain-containing protein n=1 Tax=Mytilus coruscus TaxID=42192 RepID=A0A6J8CG62_MYTCO|nr:unnamed protein product [Mytilus coruscus]
MTVSDSQTHVYLNLETKDDMRIWLQFLDSFNGKSMFLNESFMSSYTLELHTDAAQSKGYAGIYRSKWFYGPFPENWEFYHIILAIELWGYCGEITLYYYSLTMKHWFLKAYTRREEYICRLPFSFTGRTVFENSPSCSTQTVLSSTSIPATELLEYVTILANAALAPSIQATWKTFDSFCTEIMNQSLQPPISVATISLFIAFMFKKSYAPSTISTYLSAIAYVHKMMSMPDNTRSFLVEKLVTGTYRLSKTFDSRLPITIPILNKLLHSITLVIKCTYDQVLFKAIFLFAFSTFSRVGELVTTKNAPNDNVLLLHDVSLSYVQGKAAEVQVCFRKFKRNVRGMPKTILFSHGTAMESAVVAMVEYLKVRPYSAPTEPLFCSVDATPLHRPDFDRILHKCLASCGLDSSRYKGHSFRIGAATDAAERGLSDSQIRSMGR